MSNRREITKKMIDELKDVVKATPINELTDPIIHELGIDVKSTFENIDNSIKNLKTLFRLGRFDAMSKLMSITIDLSEFIQKEVDSMPLSLEKINQETTDSNNKKALKQKSETWDGIKIAASNLFYALKEEDEIDQLSKIIMYKKILTDFNILRIVEKQINLYDERNLITKSLYTILAIEIRKMCDANKIKNISEICSYLYKYPIVVESEDFDNSGLKKYLPQAGLGSKVKYAIPRTGNVPNKSINLLKDREIAKIVFIEILKNTWFNDNCNVQQFCSESEEKYIGKFYLQIEKLKKKNLSNPRRDARRRLLNYRWIKQAKNTPDLTENTIDEWVEVSMLFLEWITEKDLDILEEIDCINKKRTGNSIQSAIKIILRSGFKSIVLNKPERNRSAAK